MLYFFNSFVFFILNALPATVDFTSLVLFVLGSSKISLKWQKLNKMRDPNQTNKKEGSRNLYADEVKKSPCLCSDLVSYDLVHVDLADMSPDVITDVTCLFLFESSIWLLFHLLCDLGVGGGGSAYNKWSIANQLVTILAIHSSCIHMVWVAEQKSEGGDWKREILLDAAGTGGGQQMRIHPSLHNCKQHLSGLYWSF